MARKRRKVQNRNKLNIGSIQSLIWSTIIWLFVPFWTRGQGTIQIGFEEFSVGVKPPFVSLNTTTISGATVADASTFPATPPFEGQNYLLGHGSIFLASPDGQPIQSYTMRLFLRDAPNLIFGVQGRIDEPLQFDTWQTIQGSFLSPVQRVGITGFYSIGETFGYDYAIDAVELTTIPEPQTFWLLTLGLGAILLRRSKTLKTQSG